MDIKKERTRIERLEKLVDAYEQANRRMSIMNETHDFFNNLFGIGSIDSRYIHNVQITQAAKKRIEAAYYKTLNS